MLKPIWAGLLDLLAPPTCPACELPTPTAHAFCGACAPLIERTEDGLAMLGGYHYAGPLADAIRRYKYRRVSEIAASLVPLLTTVLAPLAGSFDVISFVPLHPRRLRERGFDQTGLLVHGAARRLSLTVRGDLLVRRRSTEVQASLDRKARATNVRDAFAARAVTRGLRVLLVDDVRTTGATLAEASRVLTDQGAIVQGFALAVADEDLG